MTKPGVALVTDSTAGLSTVLAESLGISVVPASFAFSEERFLEGDGPASSVYERMASTGIAPRSFGAAEAGFRKSFEEGLRSCGSVLCLVTPFDVNPSFTTANAAMLAIQFDEPEARIKVANAGVGSAGLGALLISLAEYRNSGASIQDLLNELDELEPLCDSLFVPEHSDWLERSGRRAAIEERLGALDDGTVVVRLGTRVTGVTTAGQFEAGVASAVELAGKRAGDVPLNAVVLHANAPEAADRAAAAMRERWDVKRLEIGELPATHGAQLGPGTVGIGVCPARERGTDAG